MALKLKTGKTINKVLAGAGVVALLGIVGNTVAPGFMGSTMGRAVEGIAAYSIGGVESVIGAAATMFMGGRTTSTALDNTLTQTL
ncbi:MAG TPA: hypothetical protein EYN67_06840 [Flavobacteriales bacterium]|nr:hypothetical protein [Flavobacteriales bacterium]